MSTAGPNERGVSDRNTLTLVLPGRKEGDDRYAVVLLPESYEAAKDTAIQVLGKYINLTPESDIFLRYSMQNKRGEWIWADILPADWRSVVQGGSEIGIFLSDDSGNPNKGTHWQGEEETFVEGCVPFTYWVNVSGSASSTRWKLITSEWEMEGNYIDRPISYQKAVEKVKIRRFMFDLQHMLDDLNFTFYTFPNGNLSTWVAIPDQARTDEALWRSLVPPPGKILGVIITNKRS